MRDAAITASATSVARTFAHSTNEVDETNPMLERASLPKAEMYALDVTAFAMPKPQASAHPLSTSLLTLPPCARLTSLRISD